MTTPRSHDAGLCAVIFVTCAQISRDLLSRDLMSRDLMSRDQVSGNQMLGGQRPCVQLSYHCCAMSVCCCLVTQFLLLTC